MVAVSLKKMAALVWGFTPSVAATTITAISVFFQAEDGIRDITAGDWSSDVCSSDLKALMNFEQDEEEALNLLIPKYVTSLIYGSMVEAVASENGARMQAMDSATSNAEEMIDKLSLQYNRARQGSITQELTEIIAGAEAIS